MIWYEGNISEAVEKAKLTKACLLVFVEGKDEISQRLEGFLNEDKIQKLLLADKFVPIRIASGTTAYMHFAAIYKVVPVPSIFFIGEGGTPLEIATALLQSSTELEQKLKRVLDSLGFTATPPTTTPMPRGTPAPAPICVDGVCSLPTAVAESTGAKPKVKLPPANTEENERLVREQHLRQVQEKLRRNRLVEQEARDRVRAQIAADRKERAEVTSSQNLAKNAAAPTVQAAATPLQADVARLQFRFANGESQTHAFQSSDTMNTVREYVRQQLLAKNAGSAAGFVLSTTYPKRELGAECDGQTLAELSLCPSAVILIIMLSGAGVTTSLRRRFDGVFTLMNSLFWALCTPLTGFFNYLGNLVRERRGGNNINGVAAAQAKKDDDRRNNAGLDAAMRRNANRLDGQHTVTNASDNNGAERRRWAGGSNIHRLTDQRQDDEDDNATWNGNSTQQQ